MKWQEVWREFWGDHPESIVKWPESTALKSMAEEIALLRERLGPAGTEMLRELKRIREKNAALEEYEPIPIDVSELLTALSQAESQLAESRAREAHLLDTLEILCHWEHELRFAYGRAGTLKGSKRRATMRPREVRHGIWDRLIKECDIACELLKSTREIRERIGAT